MELHATTAVYGDISSVDMDIRKSSITDTPHEGILGWVDGTVGYISIGQLMSYRAWEPTDSYKDCVDITVVYDGTWVKRINDEYTFLSDGAPYIATVHTNGDIILRRYNSNFFQKVATGASRVKSIRGWKNIMGNDKDQGIVLVYIKSGVVYTLSVYPEPNGQVVIGKEIALSLGTNVRDIRCVRTSDYRVAIIAYSVQNVKVAFTERCWAGISGPDESIQSTITAEQLKYDVLKYKPIDTPKEMVYKRYSNIETKGLTYLPPHMKNIYNTDSTTITLVNSYEFNITDTVSQDIKLVFTEYYTGKQYTLGALSHKLINPNTLVLTCQDFSNARGDITIEYIDNNSMMTEAGTSIGNMSFTFTPTGLVPVKPNPPVAVSATNILYNDTYDLCVEVQFDKIINNASDITGSLKAFSVISNEYEHVNGDLIHASKDISSISLVNATTIRLTVDKLAKFNNAESISVVYDGTLGYIFGDRPLDLIDSFKIEFSPTGLIHKPHQWQRDNISIERKIDTTLETIKYTTSNNTDKVYRTYSGSLTYVDVDIEAP